MWIVSWSRLLNICWVSTKIMKVFSNNRINIELSSAYFWKVVIDFFCHLQKVEQAMKTTPTSSVLIKPYKTEIVKTFIYTSSTYKATLAFVRLMFLSIWQITNPTKAVWFGLEKSSKCFARKHLRKNERIGGHRSDKEKKFSVKSVSQQQLGHWTKCKDILPRQRGWSDLWKISQAILSFLIRATWHIS